MNKVIQQEVEFENTTTAELFDIYINPKKHSAILGESEVKITQKEGDAFSLMLSYPGLHCTVSFIQSV